MKPPLESLAIAVPMKDRELRLLLVDNDGDQPALLSGLLRQIARQRYRLDWCAQQNDEALRRILSADYDAVLLDIQRRPRDALALLRSVQDRSCDTPIIALTEWTDIQLESECIAAGAADCLARARLLAEDLERSIRLAIERKRVEQQYAQLAHYDPLTGVPNRILFRDRLMQAVARARRQNSRLALLHVDLDGFAEVNQSFGHDAGDRLVMATAERLQLCVRKVDSLARIGGDEFTVILEDIRGTADIIPVVGKITDFLSRPFELGERQLGLGCSVGIVVFPEGGSSVDELLTHADLAMKQAKREPGSHYRFYSEQMDLEAKSQMHLESDLRRAIRGEQFELHYQPRVELDGGRVLGVEALIRWRHPERGLLAPQAFIPLAEETGLIMPIGYWALHRACHDLALLQRRGYDRLDVAVNLSFHQLQDEAFVATASRILQQSAIDPSRLECELTETAVMSNYEQTYRSMSALSRQGIRFSLDDFGTGFSSFAHIQRLPIAALKLDRSFVGNVLENEDDATIVKAMINLAHSLKLRVIAEGAESLEQVQFLWQHHCDQIQGYYFSTPVTLAKLLQLLEQRAIAAR